MVEIILFMVPNVTHFNRLGLCSNWVRERQVAHVLCYERCAMYSVLTCSGRAAGFPGNAAADQSGVHPARLRRPELR